MLQKCLIGLLIVLLLSTVCSIYFLGKARMEKSNLLNLGRAVPSTDMYETTAIQLTTEEVEKASGSGFFSYVEKFIKIKQRSNPITISGNDIEKVPPTNPNIQPLKDVKLFRSCFYNSPGYELENRDGIFVAQAILFKNKKAADSFEKDALIGFRAHYLVVLRKGNIICIVNMFLITQPTNELFELVKFVEKQGFRSVVVDRWTAQY